MKLKILMLLCALGAAACAEAPAGKRAMADAPPPPAGAPGSAQASAKAAPPAALPPASSSGAEPAPGEAEVTIKKSEEMTIEEYRVGNRLYMIKVTPKHGPPYYLVDDRGDGRFVRRDGLDTGFSVPMWVIKKF